MMDDENDNRRRSNSFGINGQDFPVENVNYPRNVGKYVEDDDDEDDTDIEEDIDDGDDDDDDDGGNGVQRISNYEYGDEDDNVGDDFGNFQRHPKKRKLKTLLSNYEFAPRLPAQSSGSASASKPSYGGRNPLTDWTENETFILLNVWGDRFLKQGRKSLRSEEWQDVAEKVSQDSKIERTDTQCRNRLDTLKKKYKKEKTKFGDIGSSESKWIYFKKMDALLSPLPQKAGLSCGVDSGEYVFMDPKVYLDRSNGFDEMRDSPENSESDEEGEDESGGSAVSYKLLADSIQRFSGIYEKIESSKRQQMVELEKMRMDFHRDLEFQKRQILERAQAEIEKIRRGDDDDNDDNGSS